MIISLLGAAKIACGVVAARAIGKGVTAVRDRIFSYEKSRAYKQTEQNAARQRELEIMRESFQARLQQENINAQERIALFNRHSSMLLAEKNAHFSLRHALVQDAIRNFPLNISPLVILENNNIDISFLLGASSSEDVVELSNIFDQIDSTKPLNVFITPMHIDSRVNGKELAASLVFDSVYSSLESVFVKEYSRNSERPVIFYSTAWNKNVKAGLHAADELYYFLKEMPTIVVEPRFDGKAIKLLFSCWGIGYSTQTHCRQELAIPLDFNSMIAISAYERSKAALKSLESCTTETKILQEQKAMFKHNVDVFEQLELGERITKRLKEIAESGFSSELDELGDYCKMLYINQNDIVGIADTVSATIGMMIAAISDTHHLLANDITPRFPYIYNQYFNEYINPGLLNEFRDMYERTYLNLIQEFPEQESRRLVEKENALRLLGSKSGGDQTAIHDSLIQKCIALGATETSIKSYTTAQLIDYYIDHIDDDAKYRKSIIPLMSLEQRTRLDIKLITSF